MEIKDNRLVGVDYKPSPNIGGFMKPSFLIEHFDGSPNSTGAISWMQSKESKVSAHLHIARDGKITQLVDFNRVAWHAGVSVWRDINGLNSHSVGIEIQNTGSQEYPKIQMDAVIEVSKLLRYSLGINEIIGHEDIAPIRKSDPSGVHVDLFDWVTLLRGCCMTITPRKSIANLNIRRGQGTQYPIVAKLKPKQEVYELNRIGVWSKIQIKGNNQTGYVSNTYLV